MTIKRAQRIISIDTKTLNEAELQKYKVSLLDAWRYAKGDYGYNNDFFVWVGELRAHTPKDYWLLKNIESKMDELGFFRAANNRPRKENFMKTEKEIKIETVKEVLEVINKHLDGFEGIRQALNIVIKTKYGISLDRE